MTIKGIEVIRVASRELPSWLCLQLNCIYKIELEQFVVIYDARQQLLYVNHIVPEEDIQKFIQFVSWPSNAINDPDCPISSVVDYIWDTYGCDVHHILGDANRQRQSMMADARAAERAEVIIPQIEEFIRSMVDGNAPDPFDEELASLISTAGNKAGRRTARNLVGYSTKYMFYLGYLMGAGMIKL